MVFQSPESSDYIIILRLAQDVRRLVVEGFNFYVKVNFPADCPHHSDFHSSMKLGVLVDSRVSQHIAKFAFDITIEAPHFLFLPAEFASKAVKVKATAPVKLPTTLCLGRG